MSHCFACFPPDRLAAGLPLPVLRSLLHPQVPLEDDQIFLHVGEMQYVAARQQGKSAAQAYYLPSKVGARGMMRSGPAVTDLMRSRV